MRAEREDGSTQNTRCSRLVSQPDRDVKINGRRKFLGRFDDEIDAAVAYDVAAENAWGDDVYLNREHFRKVEEVFKLAG